jgi:hypothetical protein
MTASGSSGPLGPLRSPGISRIWIAHGPSRSARGQRGGRSPIHANLHSYQDLNVFRRNAFEVRGPAAGNYPTPVSCRSAISYQYIDGSSPVGQKGVMRRTSASRRCRLFRDGVQFCSGLVDLAVGIGHHLGGGHRLTLSGERFVGRPTEHIAEVSDRGAELCHDGKCSERA